MWPRRCWNADLAPAPRTRWFTNCSDICPDDMPPTRLSGGAEAGSVLGRRYTQPFAKDHPHPVRRAEAAVICDRLQRLVARLQQHSRRIDSRAFDEFMWRDPCFLDKMPGEVARAHTDLLRQRLQRVPAADMCHDMRLRLRDQ